MFPLWGVYRKPKTKSIIVCGRASDFQGPLIEKSGGIGKGQGQRKLWKIINAPGTFDISKGIGGEIQDVQTPFGSYFLTAAISSIEGGVVS